MSPNLLDFTTDGQAIINMPNYKDISFLENLRLELPCVYGACSPRTGKNKAQSEPANEMNWEGKPSFFHVGAQVLPDDEHPYLLYDCRRSIYFDLFYLGVPSIVLQILSSPELRRSGFAGVHKFRIVTQYHSPSNP